MPRLTLRMVARLQGFPDSWQFHGRKTTAYLLIGGDAANVTGSPSEMDATRRGSKAIPAAGK